MARTARLFANSRTLNLVAGNVDPLQDGNAESGGLACAVLSTRKDVPACESDGDALLLDWGGLFEALFKDPHQQLALEEVVLEIIALGCCDILCKRYARLGSDRQVNDHRWEQGTGCVDMHPPQCGGVCPSLEC